MSEASEISRAVAALARLSPCARRSAVAAGALLAFGAVMAALTLIAPHSDGKRKSTMPRPVGTRLQHASLGAIGPPSNPFVAKAIVSLRALYLNRQQLRAPCRSAMQPVHGAWVVDEVTCVEVLR